MKFSLSLRRERKSLYSLIVQISIQNRKIQSEAYPVHVFLFCYVLGTFFLFIIFTPPCAPYCLRLNQSPAQSQLNPHRILSYFEMQKKLEIAPHSKILKVWWCSGAGNSHKPLHRQNSPPYRIISSTLSFYFLKGTAKVDAMYKKGFNFSSVDPTCTLIKADAVICPLKSSSMKKTEANNQRDAGYIFMKLTHDAKKHKKPTKKVEVHTTSCQIVVSQMGQFSQ